MPKAHQEPGVPSTGSCVVRGGEGGPQGDESGAVTTDASGGWGFAWMRAGSRVGSVGGSESDCVRRNRSQGGGAPRRGAAALALDLSVVRLGVSAARPTHRVRRVLGPAAALSLPELGLGPSSPGGTERLTRWTTDAVFSEPGRCWRFAGDIGAALRRSSSVCRVWCGRVTLTNPLKKRG